MDRQKITVRYTENADAQFMDYLCLILEVWGTTYYNKDMRTLVILPNSERSEQQLKGQLAQLVSERAPLTWTESAA